MHDEDENVSPEVGALLKHQVARHKRVAGAEPKDLETVARWVDGELAPAEAERVRARVEADPELREVVARLRDADGEQKVVAFQPKARAELTLGQKPKRNIVPAVLAAVAVLAAAAAVLIAVGPQEAGKNSDALGAGFSGGGLGVKLEEGRIKADGAQGAWLVSREGVVPLQLDEVGGGFIVPEQRSWCSWVVVSDWTDDLATDAKKLEGAVTGDKCVIEPADALRSRLSGTTKVGAKKL